MTMNLPALPSDHRGRRVLESIRENLILLTGLVAAAWALEFIDLILRGSLDGFGIRPRTLEGLWGIALMSFLHGGFGHLLSNTVPFLLLGGIVLLGGRRVFGLATLVVLAVGGGALWTLGPVGTNHIGASLLVFGYLGFLLTRGIVERSPVWIAVSVLVLALYGGLIRGIFPAEAGVSWQGHLSGFVAGIIAARVIFTREKTGRVD